MNITLKIESSELAAAMNNLASAITSLSASGNCVAELLDIAKKAHVETLATVETVAAAESKVEETPVVKTESGITAESLRAKAAEVAKAGKQAQVKALLNEFGAANISTIPEEKRAAFYKALEALE